MCVCVKEIEKEEEVSKLAEKKREAVGLAIEIGRPWGVKKKREIEIERTREEERKEGRKEGREVGREGGR